MKIHKNKAVIKCRMIITRKCFNKIGWILKENKRRKWLEVYLQMDGGLVIAMEKEFEIYKNLGRVPCGRKIVETVEIENKAKKSQVFLVESRRKDSREPNKLRIHPVQAVVQPKQAVRFTLTYLSNVEDTTDNFSYNILNSEKIIARLNVQAKSIGPCLNPTTFNLKFFRFYNVAQTVKHIEIMNTAKCDAKFYIDLDEDNEEFEILERSGIIQGGLKLGLKLTFNPLEPGVYFKKIFCLVQFHKPIILNVLGIYQPKLKIELKSLTFKYPPEPFAFNSYEAYMNQKKMDHLQEGDKTPKSLEKFKTTTSDETIFLSKNTEEPCNEGTKTPLSDSLSEAKYWNSNLTIQVFLTANFIDIKNSPEVPRATTLVNLSNEFYYYEWDHDPKNHFQIEPCKGLIKPNTRTSFTIYFTPSVLDYLYHTEIDIRIFPCNNEPEADSPQIIYLPLTISVKIIGYDAQFEVKYLILISDETSKSQNQDPPLVFKQPCTGHTLLKLFIQNSIFCGWIAQCKIIPKTLYLRSCVPDENVYGTFMIERQGHLPFSYVVLPPEDPNLSVQPPLGYLSKDFQLFVVQFSSESKEPGIYAEDIKIKFNNSDSNVESMKVVISVEIPTLLLGKNNSITFAPIFPGSKALTKIPVENPTNLQLSYEFKVPDDITWIEIVNSSGLIEPKSFDEVEVIFKPDTPCEYLDYIPCYVSSTLKMNYTETIQLQIIGSSQYGYLVATPSIYDFGECIYKEKKTVKIHLFNFSPVSLCFRLTVHGAFGDPQRDVKIFPSKGRVAAKGSLEAKITVTPHEIDILQYEIKCQNFEDDFEEAAACEDPVKVFSFRFEGVSPTLQIIDLNIKNGGPLFSQHWLWKMLCVDKINEVLRSLEPQEVINVTLPEAEKGSPSVSIILLLESTKHGEVTWDASVEITCPCIKSSEGNFQESVECTHKKALTIAPLNRKVDLSMLVAGSYNLRCAIYENLQFFFTTPPNCIIKIPKKTLIATLTLHYNFVEECNVQIILKLPYKRKLILKAVMTTFPEEGPLNASAYLNPTFCLKPVFIGDLQPPLQLFWLYNNTQRPVSYFLDNLALREATTVKGIFDCINPIGNIPPFSSVPLGFVFSPNEIISYSVESILGYEDQKPICIRLTGGGLLNVQPSQEIVLEKTIPKIAMLENENIALECRDNIIDIPFFRTFSRIKRFFFIKNKSKTNEWAFHWHKFNVEDVLTATVYPEKGVVGPDQEALMTLSVKSYSHHTFVSCSVPCDIISYSELKAYEKSLWIRNKMAEKSKDYFTITEKGISQEVSEYPISKKPEPYHIFLTVNVNIISSLNMEQKLTPIQQSMMSAENEMESHSKSNFPLKSTMLPIAQGFLEKLVWEVLCSNNAANNLENLRKSHDYIYLQIIPENKKKTEEGIKHLMSLPNKNHIQNFLESRIKDFLCTHFIPKK